MKPKRNPIEPTIRPPTQPERVDEPISPRRAYCQKTKASIPKGTAIRPNKVYSPVRGRVATFPSTSTVHRTPRIPARLRRTDASDFPFTVIASARKSRSESYLTPKFSCGRFYHTIYNQTTFWRPSAATFVRWAAHGAQPHLQVYS